MIPSLVVLPDELITEVLSFLSVKYLFRFRCVSKYWNTLVSSTTFVKLHLERSAKRNPLFTLITCVSVKPYTRPGLIVSDYDYCVVPYPMSCLTENPTVPLSDDPYYYISDKECCGIVGTCNGLICLLGDYFTSTNEYLEHCLLLWNPATKKTSPKFGHLGDFYETFLSHGFYNFKFGFDNSNRTYKVVAFRYNPVQLRSNVKILSFGDNVWRDIESFPVVPVHLDSIGRDHFSEECVYLSGTINWLAIHNNIRYNCKDIKVGQFVIVSLDLGTETYNQYMLPPGFDEVPYVEPTFGVLGDCLCFSCAYKETDLVIWQMKEFGVEESWTQFLKINCQNPSDEGFIEDEAINFIEDDAINFSQAVPLLLAGDGHVLFKLTIMPHGDAVLYNWRDDKGEEIEFTGSKPISNNNIARKDVRWWWAMDYVESLVSFS